MDGFLPSLQQYLSTGAAAVGLGYVLKVVLNFVLNEHRRRDERLLKERRLEFEREKWMLQRQSSTSSSPVLPASETPR